MKIDTRQAAQPAAKFSERSKVNGVMALSILLALPFLNQAFHVDDPTFLALAAHAWPNPLDLYKFDINWLGSYQPAFRTHSSPPLVGWYLACINTFGGGEEWVFHAAFLPFLVLALEGMYRLAKRFAPSGATLIVWWAAASPALVLASHTIMPDLPLLALLTLGLAFTIEGIDRQQLKRAFLGSLFAGLTALCRYSGILAIPLILMYMLLKRTRYRIGLTVLCGVSLPIALWTLASIAHYGEVHYLAIVGFQGRALASAPIIQKSLYEITALSLALALPALLHVLISREVSARAVSGLLVGAAAGLLLGTILGLQAFAIGLLTVGVAAGTMVLTLALIEAAAPVAAARRTANWEHLTDSVFLSLWLFGILAFNLSLLFAAVRYLLPALPPALIILVRSYHTRRKPRAIIAGAAALLITLLLADSDRRLANAYRDYAANLAPSIQQRWFLGHWGMQYYLERTGAKPYDMSKPGLIRAGDEIIMPFYAAAPPLPETIKSMVVEKVQFHTPIILRSMTLDGWACFYSNVLGPGPGMVGLPYGVDRGPLETLTRLLVIP